MNKNAQTVGLPLQLAGTRKTTQIALALKLGSLKEHYSGPKVWNSQLKGPLKKRYLMIMENLPDRISKFVFRKF